MTNILGFEPANVIASIQNAFAALMPRDNREPPPPGFEPAASVAGAGFQAPTVTLGGGFSPAPTGYSAGFQPAGGGYNAGFQPASGGYNAGFQAGGGLGGAGFQAAPLASGMGFQADPYGWSDSVYRREQEKAAKAAAAAQPGSTPSSGGTGAGASPGVAKWAGQTRQVFGDLLDPDVMLAIMENESGGDPDAYNPNAPGGAWGLFQNVGLGSNDPNAQFAAARKLAEQKVAAIAQSYKANGRAPDERTRARDFALAWAGHFDYATGLPNPASRDAGSGQTADELSRIFLSNYDRIKAAGTETRSQYKGGGLASITGGQTFPIMQEFGDTDYSAAHPDTYAYAAAYGAHGHTGIDWNAPLGTQVYVPVGGRVKYVGNDGTGYWFRNEMTNSDPDRSGEFALELPNGDILILGHMQSINYKVGDVLDANTLIGLSGGSDGAHVHIEYRRKNADGGYTIVDPRSVLGG